MSESPTHHTGRRRGAVVKPVIFVVILLLCLAVFEVIARSLDIDFNPNPTRRFHPTLGWTQERSMNYEFDMEGHRVRVEFNALGFRDVEHAFEKPAGTKRLVVIGDSFSEAIQVNIEDTYWKRLETLLSATQQETWQVINLGVGDYGHAQAYRALVEYGLKYSPDVLVFQIFPLNDICNNSIELAEMCHSTSDLSRPYFIETASGLQLTWVQPVRHWLRANLLSFGVSERAYLSLRGEESAADAEARNRARYQARGFQSDPIFYTFAPAATQPPPVVTGWRITESALRMVDALCRERGIRWLPVVMPTEVFVGKNWESFSPTVAHLRVTRDYADRRIETVAAGLGIPAVSLLELFDQHQDVVLPYRGDHLNPAAHGLAASAIHQALFRANIVSAKLPLRITFGSGAARAWMRDGWFGDETAAGETFAWNNGDRSVIELTLPTDRDVAVTFDCVPLVFPHSPRQTVTVVLNGTPIEEIALNPARQRYSLVLPKEKLQRPGNTLELRYAFTRQPRQVLQDSADTRPLAVAWYSMEFSEAGR